MKKLLVALLALGIIGFMATPALVSAAEEGETIPGECEIQNQTRLNRIEKIIGSQELGDAQVGQQGGYTGLPCLLNTLMVAQDYMFWIILVVALIMMLVGAFQFLTAGGNEDKTGNAQQTLIYALVGVAVAFLARFAIDAVVNMLG